MPCDTRHPPLRPHGPHSGGSVHRVCRGHAGGWVPVAGPQLPNPTRPVRPPHRPGCVTGAAAGGAAPAAGSHRYRLTTCVPFSFAQGAGNNGRQSSPGARPPQGEAPPCYRATRSPPLKDLPSPLTERTNGAFTRCQPLSAALGVWAGTRAPVPAGPRHSPFPPCEPASDTPAHSSPLGLDYAP